MTYNYFEIEHAIKIHDEIIELSGGLKGIKNIGITESTLKHIQNDDYYPTFEDKLNHLFYCIVKNHSFNDGNKRSTIALSAYFLKINNYKALINHFIKEMENIVVAVADNKIDKQFLKEIITYTIQGKELSEGLKLQLINQLEK
jgi:death on curing protein